MTQRIVITPGEPAGIGPDLCIELLQRPHDCEILLACDPALLMARACLLGLPIHYDLFNAALSPTPQTAGSVKLIPVPLAAPVIAGQLERANAPYVLETLQVAVTACLQGECAALVTGPVHKGIINDAGIAFSGHTELLAELTHTAMPVMMLAAPGLRVALATTHLPVSQVSAAITKERLENVLTVLHHDLKIRFAIADPRILVCGLNPHAGEGGHLGREEIDVIQPVLDKLRAHGIPMRGPLPADTLFTPPYLTQCDAVVAMYHDQGLPVLKHMGFGQAVNITLGLPIIRTSVDHGTALDLAGSGRASATSLEAALLCALEMAERHNTQA